MKILGIETSCDETSVAVVEDTRRIIVNHIYSQIDHEKFGGIVPEIASRQQLKKLPPLYDSTLDDAGMSLREINGIAVTMGPGLVGSLLVGVNFAKGLAWASGLPLIGINHIEGHIFSNLLEHDDLQPPFIALVVSGGHTMLFFIRDLLDYELLGQTRDDAAGEAYDKVAKLLGLGYPGGKVIDDLARKGDPGFHKFPRAFIKDDSCEFSFSGLKTAVLLYLREKGETFVRSSLEHICASFQEAVVDVLVAKAMLALAKHDCRKIALAGGVAANSRLREKLKQEVTEAGAELYCPSLPLCTDNAAMIASAGCMRIGRGQRSDLDLNAFPYLPLAE